MKYLFLCALLAPIIYLALRQKKWYLYLLFGLIGFLPDHFSVQLHSKLPLITGTRVLILIVAVFWLIKKWKKKELVLPISLLSFLAINLIISAINLQHGFNEVNRIFLYVVERAFLIIAVTDFIDDKEEFNRCIDFMILGCVAISIIAIIQTVWEYDIASVLQINAAAVAGKVPDRMTMTRAFGTFNAISFACYCGFMLLPIYLRLDNTKKQYYSIAFAITFVAMICTFTRGVWLCAFGIFFALVVLRKGKPVLQLLPSVGMVLVLFVSLCFAQPKLHSAFVETGKSTINTVISVLPDSWFETEKPAETVDAGKQPNAETPDKGDQQEETQNPEGGEQQEETQNPEGGEQQEETENPENGEQQEETENPENGEQQEEPEKPNAPDNDKTTTDNKNDKPKKPQKFAFTLDKNFGLNANAAVSSRNNQWSAVTYMKQEGHFLFGYGYDSYNEGKLYYKAVIKGETIWVGAHAIDVGLVSLFTESGLIGFTTLFAFLLFMVVVAWIRKNKDRSFDFYRLVIYMIPMYVMLNIMSSFLNKSVIWLFFALFYAYHKIDGYPCEKCIRLGKKQTDSDDTISE